MAQARADGTPPVQKPSKIFHTFWPFAAQSNCCAPAGCLLAATSTAYTIAARFRPRPAPIPKMDWERYVGVKGFAWVGGPHCFSALDFP